METTEQTTQPRIYVACLAAYNNGILHGTWIDASQPREADIAKEIKTMLQASPIPDAEEYAIHDHEGFGGLPISKHASIEDVRKLAVFVAEHGALGVALAVFYRGDIEQAREALEE